MFKTKIVGILFILSAVTMFSVQTLAASCGDFSGTYKGSMSNSNYAVSATVTQPTDCSSISIRFYGVDRDFTLNYKLGPAAATLDATTGIVHTMASLHDYSSLYLIDTDADSHSPQSNPAYAQLTVISLPTADHLIVSFLGGLLITFDGTRATSIR
jgi:hypothetical protein